MSFLIGKIRVTIQPFMIAGVVLSFVWFGWQLGVIAILLTWKVEA